MLVLGIIGLLMVQPARAETGSSHVMFILDASNSMWARIDGVPKIDIAKGILASTAADLPAGTLSGLIAYGHRFNREENDCDDMELIGGYYTHDRQTYQDMLDYVTPRGQTPIANTLLESINWVSMDGAQNPTIVLITDGIESCGGDPCAAAAALADAGISTKIHVVGFDLSNAQRDAMQCIAENGHGKFFSADDAAGLQVAMAQVNAEIAQIEPPKLASEPAMGPHVTLYFEDEFGGAELSNSWTIINPDPDAYIVDAGELLIASADVGGFRDDQTKNIVVQQEALPNGDWNINYYLKGDLKTGRDSIWFGLYKDAGSSMSGHLWIGRFGHGCANATLELVKRANGVETIFAEPVRGNGGCSGVSLEELDAFLENLSTKQMALTISKRGREYSASLRIEDEMGEDGKQRVYRTDALTSLRSPGQPALAIGKWEEANGEVLVYLDRFEIELVE